MRKPTVTDRRAALYFSLKDRYFMLQAFRMGNAWWLLVLAGLATIFLYPLSYDNDTYQTMGWQLVTFGKLPYVNTWDQNFPGIVYLHAVSVLLFGNSTAGFQMLDILLQLATVTILYRLASLSFDRNTGICAALFYLAIYLFYGKGFFGQRDVYAGAAIMGSVLLSLHSRIRAYESWRYLLMGVSVGTAMLIRPTYAACLLALHIFLLIDRKPLRSHALMISGVGIILCAGLFPYLTDTAAFSDFIDATFRFNTQTYASTEHRVALAKVLSMPVEWLLSLLIIVVGIAAFYWNKSDQRGSTRVRLAFITLALCILVKIMIWVMGKYLIYHYAPIYLLLAPFIGLVLAKVIERSGERMKAIVVTAFVLLFGYMIVVRSPIPLLAKTPGSFSERMAIIEEEFGCNRWNTYPTKLQVLDYIRSVTSPTDEIECCSMDNEIVWMAERSQATRFTLIHPLGMERSAGAGPTELQKKWRAEFVADLQANPPKLVMVNSAPNEFLRVIEKTPAEILASIPGFTDLVQRSYHLDTTIGTWKMYLRN